MTEHTFDHFEFDPETLELFGDGSRIDLAPKPGLLLKAMIAAAPGIVTRDNAQSLLWPDGLHADPEQGLNACVRQLRAALGDSASAPRYVETLSKRGYRLIAPIAQPGPRRRATPRRLLAAGGAIAAVAIFAVFALRGAGAPAVNDPAGLPDAQAADLMAQAKARRARQDPGDLESALGLYERVLLSHPGRAAALAGKAVMLAKLGERAGIPGEQARAMANEYADLADAISPLADAAVARAYAALFGKWDAAAALREFAEAVGRDGTHAEAHVGMAAALSALGRNAAAVDAATRAAHIDPLSYSARSDRCWYLLFDRRPAEAADACAWAIEIDGDHRFSQLGLALAASGDQAAMEQALGAYWESMGLDFEAGDVVEGAFTCQPAARLAELRARGRASPYEVASFFGLCGNADETAAWLERAVAERQTAVLYFPYDPRFDAVRAELPDVPFGTGRRPSQREN